MNEEPSALRFLIFLIPLALLIGRTIMRGRARQNQPPPKSPPQPHIPVHFEDDGYNDSVEDDDDYIDNKYPDDDDVPVVKVKPKAYDKKPLSETLVTTSLSPETEILLSYLAKEASAPVKKAAALEREKELSPNQSLPEYKPELPRGRSPRLAPRLSPMQQAVVMAEILGPPKGMN